MKRDTGINTFAAIFFSAILGAVWGSAPWWVTVGIILMVLLNLLVIIMPHIPFKREN